ncbi:MAG: RepA [Cyanobacteria bacterium P01_A01_bin.83]
MLDCSEKTIYRWLQDGKRVGAFRKYRVRGGLLHVYLGSLFKVCWFLNLKNWGVVSQCPLSEVNAHIRATTTGIVTQKLQQASRYAANKTLAPNYRKQFGTPHPNELLGSDKQSSLKSAEGEIPYVLHKSEKRLFVSRNFLCFGTSQDAVRQELYINSCTVQRHLNILGLERRQLCQKKREYSPLKLALDNEADEFHAIDPHGSGKYTEISYEDFGDTIQFSDGMTYGQQRQIPNVYQTNSEAFRRRFFTTGTKYKTTWLAKCNIYREQYELTTMRAARRKFKYNLKHGVYYNWHSDSFRESERAG